MGIHCYTEKPLTWSVREAQLLAAAYAKNPKVVTQMGNQGHAGQLAGGWRMTTSRPARSATCRSSTPGRIAPSGRRAATVPTGTDPGAGHARLGGVDRRGADAALCRPRRRTREGKTEEGGEVRGPYHPFNWRGFVDFGSGALGDMACHTTDGIYAIMEPGYAATAEPIFMTAPVKDQFPAGMTIKMTFRPRHKAPAGPGSPPSGTRARRPVRTPMTPLEHACHARGTQGGRGQTAAHGKPDRRHQRQDARRGDYWDSP